MSGSKSPAAITASSRRGMKCFLRRGGGSKYETVAGSFAGNMPEVVLGIEGGKDEAFLG